MQNHNRTHTQRNNMHKTRRPLKYNRICELNVARVALGFGVAGAPNMAAEGNGCFVTDVVEVSESHFCVIFPLSKFPLFRCPLASLLSCFSSNSRGLAGKSCSKTQEYPFESLDGWGKERDLS